MYRNVFCTVVNPFFLVLFLYRNESYVCFYHILAKKNNNVTLMIFFFVIILKKKKENP